LYTSYRHAAAVLELHLGYSATSATVGDLYGGSQYQTRRQSGTAYKSSASPNLDSHHATTMQSENFHVHPNINHSSTLPTSFSMTGMGDIGIASEVTEMAQFVSVVEGGMKIVQGERPWR